MGCAGTAASDGRRVSNVYEVNMWLWNFGSDKPCLGPVGLTHDFDCGGNCCQETAVRKKTGRKDQAKSSALTRRRRKQDSA